MRLQRNALESIKDELLQLPVKQSETKTNVEAFLNSLFDRVLEEQKMYYDNIHNPSPRMWDYPKRKWCTDRRENFTKDINRCMNFFSEPEKKEAYKILTRLYKLFDSCIPEPPPPSREPDVAERKQYSCSFN